MAPFFAFKGSLRVKNQLLTEQGNSVANDRFRAFLAVWDLYGE